MKTQLYGFPSLPNAGLGNILIPWADCYLWCKDNNAQMINPSWAKLKIGPLIRRERDKRLYNRFFSSKGYITGTRRFLILAFSKKISIEQWRQENYFVKGRNITITFNKINNFYHLIGRQKDIHKELLRITKDKFKPCNLTDGPFIGIHVRFGDQPSITKNPICYRLPIDWYKECLQQMRKDVGKIVEAVVFSDGTDDELQPLLELPAVYRSPYKAGVTDLLALAKCSVIITSRSTFSLWGALLSQSPSVWYPGKKNISAEKVIVAKDSEDLEVEWPGYGKFSKTFIREVIKRI